MRYLITILLALLLASAAFAATPKGFLTKWSEVQKAATEQHKLIYLHFTTDWCHWCRQIEKDTYPAPTVKQALTDFVAASLDCTVPNGQAPAGEAKTNIALMTKFGGEGYPFLVMLTNTGVALHTVSGYVPPADFVRQLAIAKQNNVDYEAFLAESAKADTTSYDYNLRAMQLYRKLPCSGKEASAAAHMVLQLDARNEKGHTLDAKSVLLATLPAKDWPEQAQKLVDDITNLDPANQAGAQESAVTALANYYLDASEGKDDNDAAQKQATECARVLTAFLKRVKTVKSAQRVYILLTLAEEQLKQWDKAASALENAIAADPKSPLIDRLKAELVKCKNNETSHR